MRLHCALVAARCAVGALSLGGCRIQGLIAGWGWTHYAAHAGGGEFAVEVGGGAVVVIGP